MNFRYLLIATPLLTASAWTQAQDITQSVSEQTYIQARDQIRDQQQFREQLQQMSPEEQALYREMNAREGKSTGHARQQNAAGKGDKKRLRDGSGVASKASANDRQHSEQSYRARYGTGYQSRMDGTARGGRGRH